MKNLIKEAQENINEIIINAFKKAVENKLIDNTVLNDFIVECPKENSNGDFSTNFALVNSKNTKMAPKLLAKIILENIDIENTIFTNVEVAGPGFINFYTGNEYLKNIINTVMVFGENYGKTNISNRKVMIEFISANPTGPMHMGNARGGAIGDCLAEILSWTGDVVTREFYINNTGNQIEKFYQSLKARYYQIYKGEENYEFPETGYLGDDIKDRANEFANVYGDKYIDNFEDEFKELIVEYSLKENIKKIKSDLNNYRINFDVWFYESTLYENGELTDTINYLKSNNCTYENEGALWYKATEYGAEKDEVLVRANGFPTYFAADIAYHRNKFNMRHFDKVINIWGADHHGHVARLKGAMDAIEIDSKKLDIILMQLVRLMSDGKPVKMSKRTGKSISLADLLEETSIDAARYFFNMRSADTHCDFDLDLAVEKSNDNPVFYVQYAYARICSIFRNLADEKINTENISDITLDLFSSDDEKQLIKFLAQFPNEIANAAKFYDPSRITKYIFDLATNFHKFYNNCRVICDDKSVMDARIKLCLSTKIVFENALRILKIDAPEVM